MSKTYHKSSDCPKFIKIKSSDRYKSIRNGLIDFYDELGYMYFDFKDFHNPKGEISFDLNDKGYEWYGYGLVE